MRSRKLWSDDGPQKIEAIFGELSLEDFHEPVGTYSTGMKKKTQIAAAMILQPEVLIMDEP
jgi:ABC-type multidrug transport system ATPase subunit